MTSAFHKCNELIWSFNVELRRAGDRLMGNWENIVIKKTDKDSQATSVPVSCLLHKHYPMTELFS